MPQFWIATFFILLAVAELYQSAQDINLPFSVYLVLGVVLAVASNAHKQFSFGGSQQVKLQEVKEPTPTLTPTAIAAVTTESLPADTNPTPPEITPTPAPADKPATKKKSRPRKAKSDPKSLEFRLKKRERQPKKN